MVARTRSSSHRIVKSRRQTRYTNSNDDTNYFYYDAARRMLENWKQVSTGGPVTIYEQWVMSEIGAKLPAVRFRDADGNGTFDETQHYTWDANGNITAMLSTGGSVVERYTYDAYGAPKYWTGNWMTQLSNPAYSNRILFGGAYYQDNTTGLYYADARYYHPTLGRFISRDPTLTEFPDGPNLYQYVRGNPVNGTDPSGLSRNGMADRQPRPSGPNWIGTGVSYCEHKGFKSSGMSSHAYILVGGSGYGYYAESHRNASAGFWDSVQAAFLAPGSVADDDHTVPVGTSGPRSECSEIMVDPTKCDPAKFRQAVENWVKQQRATYPGKGGATSNYSAIGYNCYTFAYDAIREGVLNGCKKCGGSGKGGGGPQYKYKSAD